MATLQTVLVFNIFLLFCSADILYDNFCWDIKFYEEKLFCYGAVNWPVSEEVYYNREALDELAK